MAGFSILLPPADDKVSGGNSLAPKMFDRRSSHTFNYFVGLNPERRQVVEALNALGEQGGDLAATLGVVAERIDHAVACNTEVMSSPLMSALDRYRPGVMYAAMEFENLPTGAQRRLLEHGVVVSPLFGLLRPDDLIPEYYLSMDAELPGIGSVFDFWTPFVTTALNDLLADQFVWNLLPAKFAGLWEPDGRHSGLVEVGFFRKSKGKLIPLAEGLDELRGVFANQIVKGSSDSVASLEEFEESIPIKIVDTQWDEETGRGTVSVIAS